MTIQLFFKTRVGANTVYECLRRVVTKIVSSTTEVSAVEFDRDPSKIEPDVSGKR